MIVFDFPKEEKERIKDVKFAVVFETLAQFSVIKCQGNKSQSIALQMCITFFLLRYKKT